MAPELHPDEGVEDGIQTAVEVGDDPGDVQNSEFHLLHLTTSLPKQRQGVCEQGHVVGKVAQDENHHDCQDHPYSLVLLVVLCPQQGAHDAGVAEHHHHQRQQEADAHLETGNHHLNQLGCLIPAEGQLALHGDALVQQVELFRALGVEERGQRQGRGTHPHSKADETAVDQSAWASAKGSSGLNYCNVAIPTDAGEQEHATEQVDAVGRRQYLAGHRSHEPAVLLVVIDEWQGQH